MLAIRRMGLALGLSLAVAMLSASPQISTARTRPFLGPVPPPDCQPGDRTEKGVDGQLTAADRASGHAGRGRSPISSAPPRPIPTRSIPARC